MLAFLAMSSLSCHAAAVVVAMLLPLCLPYLCRCNAVVVGVVDVAATAVVPDRRVAGLAHCVLVLVLVL